MEAEQKKDNWIVKNLIWAAVFVAAVVIVSQIFLNVVTQHGKTVTVPDMTNLTFDEARRVASSAGVQVTIGDSVYVRRMRKGAVFTQNPKPGSKVKQGRMVQLTTNAVLAKKVTMPNLVGLSMRQAKAELSSKGLMLGRLVYINDMATNNVLRQLYRQHDIKSGKQIESGSTIDLVVGLNPSENQTLIPGVVGMRYLKAVDAVQDNSLNVVKLVFDETVKNYNDSLNAQVVKQNPVPSEFPVLMGSGVTLYLSTDITKIVSAN